MRRLRRIFLVLLAALIIGVLASPWWIAPVSRPLLKRNGVTFAAADTNGYSRLVLSDLMVATPAADISATRVELDTPWLLLWHRAFSQPGPVTIDDCRVTIKNTPARADDAAPASSPRGLRPVLGTVDSILSQLTPWLPELRLNQGRIEIAGAPLEIDSINWRSDKNKSLLEIVSARYRNHTAAASITLENATGMLALHLAHTDPGKHANTIDATLAGENLAATIKLLDQTAALTARFDPAGWLPSEALLDAPSLSLTAGQLARVNFPAPYTTATGSARIEYRDTRLTADIAAHAEAAPEESAPPLDIAFHAQGTPEQIDITVLDIAIPGIAAKLSAPVSITRDLRLLSPQSRFTLDADLAQQPWFAAQGRVTGEVALDSTRFDKLHADARLQAENIQLAGIAVDRLAINLTQDDHLTRLNALDLALPDGSQLNASGQYDITARTLSKTTLSARVLPAAVARFLPAGVAFDGITLTVSAEGPATAPEHRGSIEIQNARASVLENPVNITASWRGRDLAADAINLTLNAAGTELILAATGVSAQSVTLASASIRKNNTSLLSLLAPATFSRADDGSFTLEPLSFASPDGVSKLSLQAAVARAISLSFTAANIDSALFSDLVDTGPLPWHVASAEINASLPDPDAALSASVTLDARFDYAQTLPAAARETPGLPDSALINVAASLTPKGLGIDRLTVSETASRSLVAHVSGTIPITVSPVGETLFRMDKSAPLALSAHTQPDSPFWHNLAEATGITLESPRISARVEGTLRKPDAHADITIARLSFDQTRWPKRFAKLPALPPLPEITGLATKLNTDGSTINLEQFSLLLAGQPVTAAARFTLDKNLSPEVETLRLDTNADLSAFAEYSNSILAPRGRLELSLNLAPGKPLEGRLQLHDAALRPLAPLGVVNAINADARLTGRRFEIATATALIGNQPATLTGSVVFPDNTVAAIQPDLVLKASNVPFAREPGLLVRGDIDLRIKNSDTPAGSVPVIQGSLRLRESLFLADMRAFWSTRPASGPESRPPFFAIETPPLDKWRLDVDVRGPGFLRINTTVFAGRLSAAFKLDGTLGDPRLVGDATIDSGKVLLPFATFTAQSGRVRLTQAAPHMPRIEFTAASRTLGYDLRMEVRGTAENPRLTFTSSPALTSEQILLMVMAGEAPNNEINYSDQQRALSFGTYLGQGLINDIFGLSPDESRLTLISGEKLTRQGRETYTVEYKLDERWTAVGEYDEFDAYNLGMRWLAYRSKIRGPAAPPKPSEKNAEAEKSSPPKIKVRGRGFWANLTSKRMLQRTLSLDKTHGPALTANEVEDAAFLLISQLVEKGYMHPKLTITAIPAPPGAPLTFTTNETLELDLPRELSAISARFKIETGKRYKLNEVIFTHTGPSTIADDDARQFFLPDTSLFGDKTIPYAPAAISSAAAALEETLKQRGYAGALVTVADLRIDDDTGRVAAQININEGPLWEINSLDARFPETVQVTAVETNDIALETLLAKLRRDFVSKPWSQWTQQDIAEQIRQYFYRKGYPDIIAQIAIATPAAPDSTAPRADDARTVTPVAVRVDITPGPQVRLGIVKIEGNRHTRPSLISRRIRLLPGDLLNPLAIEAARFRISRLGAFRGIEAGYAHDGSAERDLTFTLTESPGTNLSLLLGWGSYEQLRGGFEIRRLNTLGIADQTRLQVIQSSKSTNGDLTFSVPDLFARNVNGSVSAFGLRREEAAFKRIEYGGTVTLRRAWPRRGYEVSSGYTYESLNNTRDSLSPEAGKTARTIAATINLSIARDRRDNPLSPKRGYNWYLQGEFASHYLGGRTDYHRYRAGFNYHTSWGRTRWIHAGISQGLISPFGNRDTPLPINKLFYPGGENTIRGYQDGEAAPRDANGAFLGAKVYTIINLELEQALIGNLNFVIFYDLLGASANLADYPGNEWLNSAGVGFRYHTILGPLRLEYGRNLNPRTDDPGGTLHFSIGIPF
ncbi:outer membrane protein assembly complex protein YaeT [Ereboglobus sp. PH5-10]|uniref:translocation/assembly module TamB domain-containing protein n=1 Tax=Ereboglobus sp. PH5-10 TaxID=2940629 RepID=UPI002405CB6E|nr:translocation/assembly module TamB domain-containing protein [Ereboglobus sp. PH5-10]MDF9828238.1 outer membrane protein assembly complex protein YaeT [Ereboglobus sp. PH5-10]